MRLNVADLVVKPMWRLHSSHCFKGNFFKTLPRLGCKLQRLNCAGQMAIFFTRRGEGRSELHLTREPRWLFLLGSWPPGGCRLSWGSGERLWITQAVHGHVDAREVYAQCRVRKEGLLHSSWHWQSVNECWPLWSGWALEPVDPSTDLDPYRLSYWVSKGDREREISCDIPYMWNLKKKIDTNELIYKIDS